jgi:hypothetical protein
MVKAMARESWSSSRIPDSSTYRSKVFSACWAELDGVVHRLPIYEAELDDDVIEEDPATIWISRAG